MAFKLIIKPLVETPDIKTMENCYHQEVVRIGRKDSNEIQLRDLRRLVSGQHAEVRQKNLKFILVDVGSKNGTQLNKQRVVAGKEYPLASADEIIIGDFSMQFFPLVEAGPGAAESKPSPSAEADDIFLRAQVLMEELNRAYLAREGINPEERNKVLIETLRHAVHGLDPENADRILRLVELNYPEPVYQRMKLLQESPALSEKKSAGEMAAGQTFYKSLLKIAERYSRNSDFLKSQEEQERFLERIDRVLQVLVKSLTAAVKGRREFEEEFDVEATRIFSWKLNPIKLAQEDRQIGEYLFDLSRKNSTTDQVIADLEEAFSDLALHQMGLMAGIRESHVGLLKKLDPELIEKEAEKKIWPLTGFAAWNHFKQKYQKLIENEVKTFETTLGPNFAKGYLSVQRKKKVS